MRTLITNYFFSLILTLSVGLISIGCSKESVNEKGLPTITEVVDLKQVTSNDLKNTQLRHREGLKYVISGFNKSELRRKFYENKSKGVTSSKKDNLEVIKFIDSTAKEYLKKNALTYSDEPIKFINYEFTDEQLLKMTDAEIDDREATPLQKEYFSKIILAYENKISNEEFMKKVDHILNEAKDKFADQTELLAVQILGKILMDSNSIWNVEFDGKTKNKNSSSRGWLSLALADATNGASGALWGSVAGPLGAAVVGVNAAIIGSSVAYIIGEADTALPPVEDEPIKTPPTEPNFPEIKKVND